MYSRPKKTDSAGYTNQLQIATGNGTLKSLFVHNQGANLVYLCFFDSATGGHDAQPAHWAPVPLPGGAYFESDTPREFKAGLFLCGSSTNATVNTIGGSDLWITAEYVY